tara:strand:+ start:1184 stop:1447 length:264 start_codon:yes stop_codon:yes gene_type:complete
MWIQSISQFMSNDKALNELELELFFMKQILQYPGSMVGNMYIKKIKGEKIWIDKLKVTYEELLTLDKDPDVIKWLLDKKTSYNDRDR